MNGAVAGLPPVYADAALIGRVLENLIGNAIKFTAEQGVIWVNARRDADYPTKLRIDVSDSGPGIPVAIQHRVFDKFVSSGGKKHGHGLGLAFCKLAIEAHGERIGVDHTGPSGTTFSFTLPVASSE